MNLITKEQKLLLVTYSAYITGSYWLLAFTIKSPVIEKICLLVFVSWVTTLIIKLNNSLDKAPDSFALQGLWYLLQISVAIILFSGIYAHLPLFAATGFAFSLLTFLRIKPLALVEPETQNHVQARINQLANKNAIHLLNQNDWEKLTQEHPELLMRIQTQTGIHNLTPTELQKQAPKLAEQLEEHFSL